MNKQLAFGAAAAALAGLVACSPSSDTATTDPAPATTEAVAPAPAVVDPATMTQEFANAVTMGNTLEIETSKVAKAKSTNADVKAYATMIIRDHTAAQAKVKTWATTAGVTLPTALDSGNQVLLDNIVGADAAGFDDKYLDTVIDAHESAISKFETYAREGADPALKQTAADLLPTLRSHFDRAKTIRDAVNRS